MEYLFKDVEVLKRGLRDKCIFLFLDYDGTLTPIAQTPTKAVFSGEIKELLRSLSKANRCRLAIVSGRALEDIKKRVGLDKIIYIGNHGLEMKGPKIRFRMPVSVKFRSIIEKIKIVLSKNFPASSGILVEDKDLTLSVHYRLASKTVEAELKNIFYEIAGPYTIKNMIAVTRGKKVFEVKPATRWDKGKAVLWILAREKFRMEEEEILPVYIGDDATDEDAFRALKKRGMGIMVGRHASSDAEYYLKDTEEVAEFLKLILEELKD